MRCFSENRLVEVQENKIFKLNYTIYTIIGGLLFLLATPLFSQEESLESIFKVDYDTPLTLDLAEEENEATLAVKPKKKKVKKKVFFGIKTKKRFTKTRRGKDVLVEIFYVLKKYEGPPEYAQDFYWYDSKKKKIFNSLTLSEDKAQVLHGPYKKTLIGSGQVVEEGWYYKGMKHRRWVRFNRNDILQEKKYWWKGWPQESRLAYYDFDKVKLKEVIPVHYKERNGAYWAFHEDGAIAAHGEYKFDQRVGLWREYYGKRRLKREVVYSKDPFDFDFKPYISKEWDNEGTLIYDRQKLLKNRK